MDNQQKQPNDTGLMAALEFINAKGDTDEMTDIVEQDPQQPQSQTQQAQQKQNERKATF